jgi:hypothetical protein
VEVEVARADVKAGHGKVTRRIWPLFSLGVGTVVAGAAGVGHDLIGLPAKQAVSLVIFMFLSEAILVGLLLRSHPRPDDFNSLLENMPPNTTITTFLWKIERGASDATTLQPAGG